MHGKQQLVLFYQGKAVYITFVYLQSIVVHSDAREPHDLDDLAGQEEIGGEETFVILPKRMQFHDDQHYQQSFIICAGKWRVCGHERNIAMRMTKQAYVNYGYKSNKKKGLGSGVIRLNVTMFVCLSHLNCAHATLFAARNTHIYRANSIFAIAMCSLLLPTLY